MLMRDSVWDAIRGQFSEEEKSELRKYVIGISICPRGLCVDAEAIPQPLQKKFMDAVHNQAVETRRNQRGTKGS